MRLLFLQQSVWQRLQAQLPFINDLLSSGLIFLGKLIGALFLILIGRWIARMVEKGLSKLLAKIGLDKLAERLGDIDFFSSSRVNIVPSQVVGKLVYYLVFFIFIWVATDIMQIAALSEMIAKLFDYLPVLLSALIVFIAGILLADFLKKIVLTTTKSLNIPAGKLIANFIFYFLFINVAVITLAQAGIETKSIEDNISIILAGIVAAFAIGYGYASRPILANMLTAYYNRNRVKVGDHIVIEEVEGEVIRIDNTSFTLQSGQREIVFPLNKLMTQRYEIKK